METFGSFLLAPSCCLPSCFGFQLFDFKVDKKVGSSCILKACDLKKACALKKACLAKEVPDILANLENETLKKVWVLTVPLRKGTSACT